ncbi:MAG: hypothetical protein Q9183_000810 [Haloplaca sp. 2 TL-2023]
MSKSAFAAYGIPIMNGIRQPFDHDNPEPFTPAIAIGTVVETEATTIVGEEVHIGQGQGHFQTEEDICASNNGLVNGSAVCKRPV